MKNTLGFAQAFFVCDTIINSLIPHHSFYTVKGNWTRLVRQGCATLCKQQN